MNSQLNSHNPTPKEDSSRNHQTLKLSLEKDPWIASAIFINYQILPDVVANFLGYKIITGFNNFWCRVQDWSESREISYIAYCY